MDLTMSSSGQVGWRTLLTWALIAVIVGSTAFLIYWFAGGVVDKAPTYDWVCTECGYSFRQAIRDASEDRPVIECPECGTLTAERMMHLQCRKCWEKFDLSSSQAAELGFVCQNCGSNAIRDLDNPIPGDDGPVEGGKPSPYR